jgi:beta-phosphoglucomutase-like phosphatase (HAD superfamily)
VIRALLFDLDGTLIDSETPEFQAYSELYARHGCELALGEWAAGIGTIDGYRPVERLSQLIGRAVDAEATARFISERYRELADPNFRPGVARLLAESDAHGLSRAVVSSSSRYWVEGSLRMAGRPDGWAGIWCGGDDGLPPKPDPALYLRALDELGLAPDEALVFEDSPNGIAAARAASIRCVAVSNPVTARLDLSDAERVVDSFEAISVAELLA